MRARTRHALAGKTTFYFQCVKAQHAQVSSVLPAGRSPQDANVKRHQVQMLAGTVIPKLQQNHLKALTFFGMLFDARGCNLAAANLYCVNRCQLETMARSCMKLYVRVDIKFGFDFWTPCSGWIFLE